MLSDLPCDSTAPYILGMLLSGEFDSPAVKLQKDVVPLNIDEAKWRIERSAYLSFGPAQYKMVRSTSFRMSDSKLGSAFGCLSRLRLRQGFSYEYATLGCLFDPLLSVQYYALASQNGEVEADMGECRLSHSPLSPLTVLLTCLYSSLQRSRNGTSADQRATLTRTSSSPSPSPRRPPRDRYRVPSSLSATSRKLE